MKILNKILFSTDFGSTFEKDLKSVLEIAQKFDSEVILLHVLPNVKEWNSYLQKVNKKIIDKMAAAISMIESDTYVKARSIIEFGDYSKKIVEVSNKENVNLILLGAGNYKNENSNLGSKAEKIIRLSSTPVWILDKVNDFSVETILCPVDYSNHSKRALDNAIHLARRFDSKLIILHATKLIDEEYQLLDKDFDSEKIAFEEQEGKDFEEFLNAYDLTNLNYEKKIITGNPSKVITDHVKDFGVDLVIMGSAGKTGIGRFFLGSIAEKVLRNTNTSFVMIKSKDFIELVLDDDIDNIKELYKLAQELVNDGYLKEALNYLNKCLEINEFYVKAWHGKAEIFERLGEIEKSKDCENIAVKIQRSIWEQQIEADLRRQHSMFK